MSAIINAEERKKNLSVAFKIGKSSIVKFSPDQVSAIMKAEEQKQSLLAPLGLT